MYGSSIMTISKSSIHTMQYKNNPSSISYHAYTINKHNTSPITAEFIITPVMLPDVIEWCAARNIVSVPGCQTPTELVNAYRHGAPLQKLFPGVAGGPGWVKAVSSALPFLSINPTSGVDLDNAGQFLEMGAASVGLVAPLFDPEAIANGDFEQIAKNAEKVMANVRPVGPYVRK
jgi:2-dehydro-3-deoxyphosphogluconate aldolase/(4S)-4-hydroxy-2-oxoglutarate aldolase